MNKNWEYVTFDKLFEWNEKSKIKSGDGLKEGEFDFFVCSDTEIKKYNKALFHGEALIFGTGGKPSLHYKNGSFAYSTDCVVASKIVKDINLKFVYYYLRQGCLKQLQEGFKGSGLQHISKKYIEKLLIPNINIKEQNRIVERIEELFSELDIGIKTIKSTNDQITIYKLSILKDVFSENFSKKTIEAVSEFVTSGSRGWAQYYTDKSNTRFVRITDLTRDSIVLKNDNIQYLSLPEKVEGKRSLLKPNDVLVSITADLGSIALIPDSIGEAYINQHIALIRFSNSNLGKCMAYYLKSCYGQKDLLKNKRGGGKLGLGLDDIRKTPVPDITEEKANELVNKIETKLTVCNEIQKNINDMYLQSEMLRQSILIKAFEGGL